MKRTVVVTGAGGFLGGALARALRARGDRVVSIARGDYPSLRTEGIETVRADLSGDVALYAPALEGAEVVFHVAAKTDMWGRPDDFVRCNVLATQKLLLAAAKAGVSRFVYTSSPSVVAQGGDLVNVDESVPYARHPIAEYPRTKARAEQDVLAFSGLQTVALRPHLIWGPGDTNLIPAIVERAASGRLIQIGDGKNLADFTYIDDCVAAHLCADTALRDNTSVRGRAFFISQGEPMPLWGFIARILEIHGIAPIKKRVPLRVALGLGWLLEVMARIDPWKRDPLLTRFLVEQMGTTHYFNIEAARMLLGYRPKFTMADGFTAYAASLARGA